MSVRLEKITRREFLRIGSILSIGTFLSSPTFSAEQQSKGGQYKIFFTQEKNEENEVLVMDENGKNLEQLTNNDYQEIYPAVSLDGRFLAYSKFIPNKSLSNPYDVPSYLHIVDLIKKKEFVHESEKLYKYGDIIWGPTNKRLGVNVFQLQGGKKPWHPGGVITNGIFFFNFYPEKGEIQKYSGESLWGIGQSYPSFSMNGNRVTYQSHRGMHINHSMITGTYTSNEDDTFRWCNSRIPLWSPRDDKILFISDREKTDVHKMYLIDVDGKNQRMLAPDLYYTKEIKSNPGRWSPDGTKIAFYSSEYNKLYILNINSNERKEVSVNKLKFVSPVNNTGYLHWSPNGENLIFEVIRYRDQAAKKSIYKVNTNGGGLKELAENVESIIACRQS